MPATLEAPKAEQWYTVTGVMALTSFGRSFLYAEMQAGRLPSKKVGGSRRISESNLAAWQSRFDGSGEVGI